ATALAGFAFSARLAWYLTSPIQQLQRGFGRLAERDFDVRLRSAVERRRAEIADLAGDFDWMAERLAERVATRDRLLHDVPHESRSPLACMRLASGLLRRGPMRFETSLDRIDYEADHLDLIVGKLLTPARLESGIHQGYGYFDEVEVLNLSLADVTFEAGSQSVLIEVGLPDQTFEKDWLVAGSGMLISRAIENILRNVVRFSPAGETITVEDAGPGIRAVKPRSLLKFVCPRWRSRKRWPCLGFLLAACGGTLDLANRVLRGLKVTISLPVASPLVRPV
ncbi:MAG: HAMP domain-containing sensor histidine kinase, partial [Novosphingobium sp.]